MATVERRPYEFLVRWGLDGKLQASHAQYRRVIIEDDGSLTDGGVDPLLPSNAPGYPLEEFLSAAQAAAVRHASDMTQQRDAVIAKARADGEALQIERAANQALRRQLQQRIVAAPAVDG